MLLYRVFPLVPGAPDDGEGGALFIPRQGAGRIDNPQHYRVYYASSNPAGAVAEVFGWRTRWSASMLRGHPQLAGSIRAIATIEVDARARVCDLDDPNELLRRSLRPSRVITRDLATTQAWAAGIHKERRFAGVSWWSYYDARWKSVGMWEPTRLALLRVEPLNITHPAISEAAHALKRRIFA